MQTFIDEYYTQGGDLFRKKDNKKVGWLCNGRYLMFDHKGKKYLVHRAIFLLHYGYLPELVDHRDQNKLNNEPTNLRESDKSGNSFNSKVRSDNTSGCRGVSFSKSNGKWFAYINFHGKRVNLGYHETKEQAIHARKTYAEIH